MGSLGIRFKNHRTLRTLMKRNQAMNFSTIFHALSDSSALYRAMCARIENAMSGQAAKITKAARGRVLCMVSQPFYATQCIACSAWLQSS
jgi:hypothetical protein